MTSISLKTRIREALYNAFEKQTSIAPLAILRMVFGAILFISILRFILKGWVTDFYISPKFYFTYYGFEWVKPLDATGMFALFYLMAFAALCIFIGFFYRVATIVFFICFTYVELIDKTYYLNHYYFVSIISFLLMLVPAHRCYSLDVRLRPSLQVTSVPAWTISVFKLQLLLVYFFAGISKLNYDWMIEAMPLKIWLPANNHLPIIGPLLAEQWIAYVFCYFGLLFDLAIGFILWNKKTVKAGYFFVVIFHLCTAYLFKIGMFPYIMIGATLIFFPEHFHENMIHRLRKLFRQSDKTEIQQSFQHSPRVAFILKTIFIIYFTLQILIPMRYILYPGNLFWTEEGYRFSWRVMLMEKAGTCFFYVKDKGKPGKTEVYNAQFLTPLQEKMMSTQPDMILQYAHFLKEEYQKRNFNDPEVTVESYVTLNGSGSRLFIDSTADLSKEQESFFPKKWILAFAEKQN
ncbi:MAG TPA: HTTM domain-containing protein [Cytophagaceae bacterium]|nr:HTTM domain-containing protein [Cytophagaceae bacterium]